MKHINSRKPQKTMAKAECTYNENKDSKKEKRENKHSMRERVQELLEEKK